MTRQTKQLIAAIILIAVGVAGTGWLLGATPPPQGDYPRTIQNGVIAPPNTGTGFPVAVSLDNHGVPVGNSVSTYNAAQGSANAAIGYAVGQALPAWVAQIGEQVHITGTTATAVKATAGVLVQLNVNTPAAGTVSIFDLATAACTGTPSTNVVAVLTATVTAPLGAIPFNTHFLNGVCVKASVAMDLTAVYQ